MTDNEVKQAVRRRYGGIARQNGSCCSGGTSASAGSCCGTEDQTAISRSIGYSQDQLDSVPEGANLGLGCGNPVGRAALKPGDTVLDLGSGAGFDAFLAAERVGPNGRVIGVDMTPDMIEKARDNAERSGVNTVEFRLGEIEHLPVADASVDLILSNCVINLSVDKAQVFREAHRVLKPSGRLMVSDIVLLKDLPESVRASIEAYVGCVAGASLKEEYLADIRRAGFEDVQVAQEKPFATELIVQNPTQIKNEQGISDTEAEQLAATVLSISVSAVKKSSILSEQQ